MLGIMIRGLIGAVIGVVAVWWTPDAKTVAAPSPTSDFRTGWHDLGTLGGENTYPSGVNRGGEVIGSSQVTDGSFRAFRWHDGALRALPTGGSDSSAVSINDRGDIAGAVGFSDGSFHATVWRHDVPTDLGTLGGGWSAAHDINNGGEVIGASNVSREQPRAERAFRWRPGQRITELTGRDAVTVANDINNHGDIVGYVSSADGSNRRGALWRGNRLTIIDPPFGNPGTAHADVINDRGQILGGVSTDDGEHGFFWDRGVFTDLGPGVPADLNDQGQAAMTDSSAPPVHAVRWRRGRRTELPTLGGPDTAASDINAVGQIAGRSSTTDGIGQPVVWSAHNQLADLAPLPGGAARFISDRGRVVGYVSAGPASVHAVVTDLNRRHGHERVLQR